MDIFSENIQIEQPTIALLAELGWQTVRAYSETFGESGTLGRAARSEVVLPGRLRAALARLNPGLPAAALDLAVQELSRDRSALAPVQANREIYRFLKNGLNVYFRDSDDNETVATVQIIDWDNPANNDFLLVSQLWVQGEMYLRRTDLVGFVNGLPLLFIELKASHNHVQEAFNGNLRDYKDTIPRLFTYNAFIILSNGSQSRLGSLSAQWEHFNEWKKISDEHEPGLISLETILRGTCQPARFLDLVENFTLFSDAQGGLTKLIAKNHQLLGVNNAFHSVRNLKENQGRLGVFWHTQGSGKSYSMVFFSQKVLRKLPGNWTFLIVTDRQELDTQIYKTFAATGAVTESEVQAESGDHLKRLLQEDHRNIFTLIQKFRTERFGVYPKLSDRSDIIVITDEAHRSQYDLFAQNMRNALPNAAFIGFTGTPLMAGEEKTREVFGDYVSVYNFKQSVEDGSTVPLYYENRIPELQLTNEDLNQDFEELIEDANLNEEQEKKLEREFAREYHLITRNDRLERIAADIVSHFLVRGQTGKALVVSIDKATAVKMYDKVQKHWQAELTRLKAQLATTPAANLPDLQARIGFLETTDMAVVISQSQNEVADFQEKGLDIAPHRRRLISEDLDKKFKDSKDPLRLVFVCAMWLTGFDVPSLSTVYLDKPMRNHTLMQTIARANRVFGTKLNGLIVDYVGVFRDLKRALAIYGSAQGGAAAPGENPVQSKQDLVAALRAAVTGLVEFLTARGISPSAIFAAPPFQQIHMLENAQNALLVNDDTKKRYLALAANVANLYQAILPDPAANEFESLRALFAVLVKMILNTQQPADISAILDDVEELLDSSIAAEGYIIRAPSGPDAARNLLDLNRIDFDALKAQFDQGHKHTQAERLKGSLNTQLKQLVRLNHTRMNFQQEFERMIEDYNSAAGGNIDQFFNNLIDLTQRLQAEAHRHQAESLTEEELALYDLLFEPFLTPLEQDQVKQITRDLLHHLKSEQLVLDWRKRAQSRAAVKTTLLDYLDRLPNSYTPELYNQKVETVYQHIYDSYSGQGRSIYGSLAG